MFTADTIDKKYLNCAYIQSSSVWVHERSRWRALLLCERLPPAWRGIAHRLQHVDQHPGPPCHAAWSDGRDVHFYVGHLKSTPSVSKYYWVRTNQTDSPVICIYLGSWFGLVGDGLRRRGEYPKQKGWVEGVKWSCASTKHLFLRDLVTL